MRCWSVLLLPGRDRVASEHLSTFSCSSVDEILVVIMIEFQGQCRPLEQHHAGRAE